MLPLCELGLGLTALWPRLWKVTALGAVLVHGGILVTLSPLFGDWNSAVWPWNAAVAVVAPMLCLSQPKGAAFPSPAIVAVAAVLLGFPALFYVGLVDAYVSHNLYSNNTAALAPVGCGSGQPGAGALDHGVAFQLGEGDHDGQHRLAHRPVGVQTFGEAAESDPPGSQLVDNRENVLGVASEAVELPDGEHVAFAEVIEVGVKLRSASRVSAVPAVRVRLYRLDRAPRMRARCGSSSCHRAAAGTRPPRPLEIPQGVYPEHPLSTESI